MAMVAGLGLARWIGRDRTEVEQVKDEIKDLEASAFFRTLRPAEAEKLATLKQRLAELEKPKE
jgi:hypothetical protein